MSRLKAGFLLLIVAVIWGVAFVPQKLAFAHIGACTFVFARFIISAVLVFPLARREWRRKKPRTALRATQPLLLALLLAFCGGVILQQAGLSTTTATNGGFLTGLYVLFVPLICALFFRQPLSPWIYPAALLSVAGTWFLSGGVSNLVPGDTFVVLCAACFGVHVAVLGAVMKRVDAPLTVACLQYIVVALVAGVWMFAVEKPSGADLLGALWPILYAGVLSGGVAYTLQAVAQRHAPASDAAIIMSGESLFAALAGALLLGERLSGAQYAGGALILAAILLTELAPHILRRRAR